MVFRRYINIEKNIHLRCCITGHPPLEVSWFKNERRLRIAKEGTVINNVRYLQKGKELIISRTDVSGSGSYRCVAQNSAGHGIGRSFKVKFYGGYSFKFLYMKMTPRAFARTLIRGCIFIYSGSAQLIYFEISCYWS